MAENEEKDVAGESKSDKFKRLASKRVVNAIQKIELITNLAAPSYEYTPEEVTKILTALQGSVDKVKAAFSSCTESKSKSAVLVPVATELPVAPPIPMRIPGPPN